MKAKVGIIGDGNTAMWGQHWKARGAKVVKAFNTQFATHMDRGRVEASS